MTHHTQSQSQKLTETDLLFVEFQHVVRFIRADYDKVVFPTEIFQTFPMMSVSTCPFCLPDQTTGLCDVLECLQTDRSFFEIAYLDVCSAVEGFCDLT